MNALFFDEPLALDDPDMSDDDFFNFCQQHRKRRDAQHEILLMAPTFPLTGKRNASLIGQFYNWAENL